jgi:hypothetical protein
MSNELRWRPDLVSCAASYIGLTNDLTGLLDRIGVTPYSPTHNWHSMSPIAKGARTVRRRQDVGCVTYSRLLSMTN